MAKPRKPQPEKVGIDSISQTNTKAIVMGVGAVIIVLAVLAAVFTLTNNDDSDGAADDADVVQFRPVSVTGSALPSQYSDPQGTQLNEAIGAQAPDITGSTFDGQPIKLVKDGRAKAVIFLAHWCQHCRAEAPLLSKWIPDNKDKYPGVDFYAVATGSKATSANYPPSAWLEKEDWPTPVMADDNSFSAAEAYGLGSYPYMVFLDPENKVVTRASGELSMDEFGKLVQRAQDAADNKPPATTSSTATTAPAAQTPVGQAPAN